MHIYMFDELFWHNVQNILNLPLLTQKSLIVLTCICWLFTLNVYDLSKNYKVISLLQNIPIWVHTVNGWRRSSGQTGTIVLPAVGQGKLPSDCMLQNCIQINVEGRINFSPNDHFGVWWYLYLNKFSLNLFQILFIILVKKYWKQ